MWNFILFILIVLPLIILSALVVGIYSNLVKFRGEVEDVWSDMDVELGRRVSLVDNLVKTVKDAEHEDFSLGKVTEALSRLLYADTVEEIEDANRKLTGALEYLFMMLEDYSDRNVTRSWGKLRGELEENERTVTEYQYLYNEIAYVYNSKLQTFPNNMVANYFGFEELEFFTNQEGKKKLRCPDLDSSPRG